MPDTSDPNLGPILAAVTAVYGPDSPHQQSHIACTALALAASVLQLTGAPPAVIARGIEGVPCDAWHIGLIGRWECVMTATGVAATVWLNVNLPCACGCGRMEPVPLPVTVSPRGTVHADLRHAQAAARYKAMPDAAFPAHVVSA